MYWRVSTAILLLTFIFLLHNGISVDAKRTGMLASEPSGIGNDQSTIPPQVQVTPSPWQISVVQGESTTINVTFKMLSGPDSRIDLFVNCSSGLTCSYPQYGTTPFTVPLTVQTSGTTPPNTYRITVTGYISGISGGGATFTLLVVTPSAKVVVFHINPPKSASINVFVSQNWQYVASAGDGLSIPLEQGSQYTLLAVPVAGPTYPAYNVDYWNFSGGISLIGYVGTRIGQENDISAAVVQVTGNATASVNFSVKSSFPSYCDPVYGANNWFEIGYANVTELGGAAVYLSDIAPDEGETITVVGAIVNPLGFPIIGVDVHFSYYPSNLVSTTDDHGVFKFSVVISPGFKQEPLNFTVAGLRGTFERDGAKQPWLLSSGSSQASIDARGQRNTVVIYESGANASGTVLNQQEETFVQSLAEQGYKVVAAERWVVDQEPSFTIPIAALFKYGFGYRTVLIGWSAGGAEVGHALTEDFASNFDGAIILNGPLNGWYTPSVPEGGVLASPAYFCSAKFAGNVHVPHILIWGKDDQGLLAPAVAVNWMEHVQRGMGRLDLFDYGHEWLNSSVAVDVEHDIAKFLDSLEVGNVTNISGVSILSNSQVSGATYSPADRTLQFIVNGTSGDTGSINLFIPKNLTDGIPIVSFDGVQIPGLIGEDANYWYVFHTYLQSTHTVTVTGLNLTIPEFELWGPLVMIMCLMVTALYRRPPMHAHHRP